MYRDPKALHYSSFHFNVAGNVEIQRNVDNRQQPTFFRGRLREGRTQKRAAESCLDITVPARPRFGIGAKTMFSRVFGGPAYGAAPVEESRVETRVEFGQEMVRTSPQVEEVSEYDLKNKTWTRHRTMEKRAAAPGVKPSPESKRWVMLFYLSALALLSDWICFSAAPIAVLVQRNLHLHDSNLVAVFLATNVAFCLLEPATVRRYGLRAAVVLGALTMALGCVLRCLATEIALSEWWAETVAPPEGVNLQRNLAIIGTMLVGAAQPFFQCTPSLLAANWFAENETTLACTVALNANQLGIAAAYAVGAGLVHTDLALRRYFVILAGVSLGLAIGCLIEFRERPPKPPSFSAIESIRREKAEVERKRTFDSLRREHQTLDRSLSREMDRDIEEEDVFDPTPPRSANKAIAYGGGKSASKGESASLLRLARCASAVEDDNDDPTTTTTTTNGDAAPQEDRPAAKLLRRWIITSRRVGHGAIDITRNMVSETRALARFEGFDACLVAFVSSIVSSNIFSTFLPHLITTAKLKHERNSTINARIAGLGTGFQLAIMGASLGFGAVVDATKAYKNAMLVAFVGAFASLVIIADDATRCHLLEVTVLVLGACVGPIQPIAAELAVEITFPDGDENHIVAVQQTVGNLVSAAAVPVFHQASLFALHNDIAARYGIRADYAMLAAVTFISGLMFRLSVWRAPLRRLQHNTSAATAKTGELDVAAYAAKSKYQTM
ncbi:hypothetical protein CTAYLR_005944 [Chrysophaeum taylorii]|uniref:Uncharacterized protein n=1 Tax=Chrysophaeum taylorii TaxID=2483200 RepID=A0AAD7UDC0_9STRA|nr:hypothetical protein CTAYLR_005944 [Chrysophaeum taylorii]